MIPRLKSSGALIFVILWCVSASVLKDALEEHLKDVTQDEGAESIKHDKTKGEKVHDIESEIIDSHKNQVSKANDEKKFLTKDYEVKSKAVGDSYQGHTNKHDKAEDSETGGYKHGQRKGHHKEGFQNSYHKDESSNKSTFFDDLEDEDDQAAYNSRLNKHDNQGGKKYHGSHNDGQEYIRDNHQVVGHRRYGDHGNKEAHHRNYGKDHYLDDQLNHNKYRNDRNRYDRGKVHDTYHRELPRDDWGRRDWGQQKGWERERGWERDPGWERDQGWQRDPGWQRDRGWQRDPAWQRRDPAWQRDRGWQRDYNGPGFYDDRGLRHDGGYGSGYGYDESRSNPIAAPKNAPVIAQRKQTITIYEDPRYNGKDKGQLRKEEGDSLQLDFKPSGQRYASYDDTYYSAPSGERAVESSKINRLVYNYRRQ